MRKITSFTFILIFLLIGTTKVQAVDFGLEFGFGVDTSKDWSNSLDKAYEAYDYSLDLNVFFELQAGIPIGINENFLVKPKVSYLTGFAFYYDHNQNDQKDVYSDSFTIPGIAVEYHLNGHQGNSFFIGAEVGTIIASSGSGGHYEFDDDSVSYGIYGGYNFNGGSKIALGYRNIPIEVTYLDGYKESKNFGGFSLQFLYTFWLK
ncbi:MAG: hypothetical protein LBD84_07570 [Campylobacteraceae bacterium]|jgi:hypothetical protein|nr:hypothetical protein [Campylobacteraceae bacterium]